MIFGIGIDIIEIDRIKKEILRYGDKFCTRIFTENEMKYCKKGFNLAIQSQCLAGRFTAKEAFFKAIGTGLRGGLTWKDVEIFNDDSGKPYLVLTKKGLELVKENRITNIQVSISHCHQSAIALVILEQEKTGNINL